MNFHPHDIFDVPKAEKAVWEKAKLAFRDDVGAAFHSYQIFSINGNLEREIDILIVHRQLGLWVIECKGCHIENIESINGCEWKMKNWHKDIESPIFQAQKQMFAIKDNLRKQLGFSDLLHFHFRVSIPLVSREQWRVKGFDNRPNTQGVVLTTEDLIPGTFKNSLVKAAGSRQLFLSDEQWELMMCYLGGVTKTPVHNPLNHIPADSVEKTRKLPQTNNSRISHTAFENIKPSLIISDQKFEYQTELKPLQQPESELELLIDEEELPSPDSAEPDEYLEDPPDEKDGRPGEVAKSRRRTQVKKKHYTEDSIRLYLQEIGRIRLLRADEEIELARKIADLLELERVYQRLSEQLDREAYDSEWAEAVNSPLSVFRYRLHIGRRAKDKMVQSNLRLVVSIAKKYMNRGLSFQDLIQEGSLGLIRAAEKFDHEKGYKFSTYATWWIRQAITWAIADQSRTIRLPVHLYETISRIKKTTKLLSQEMGRKPTEEEIATRMEMTIEKLRFIAKSAQLPISLETPIIRVEKNSWFDEEDTQEYLCLGDFIEANEDPLENRISQNLLREDLEKVLDSLSPRERDVLRLRYGLDDGRMKTLDEIGQIFNVDRERTRQIEAKALRKLRHPNRNSILKEYIQPRNFYNLREEKVTEPVETKQSNTIKVKKDVVDFHNASVYVQKGLRCHRSGNFLGAIAYFTQALKLDFNNNQIYYSRGLAKIEGKDCAGAIEDFTQAIRLNPEYIDAYYQRGQIYYNLGDSQEAIEDYSQILSLNSNTALAYFYRGLVQNTLGQIQKAIIDYNQVLKINPNLAEAYFQRGISLYHLGELHRAVEDYNQALRIYPDLAEAYSYRGLARHYLGDYKGALEDFSQAVQLNPEDGLTHYYRGLAYEGFGDCVRALEDFSQVLRINPNFAEAFYNRGRIHHKLGYYQEALEDLNRVLHINPNNAQAYNQRSTIRAALKDYQGAMEDLQKVAKLHIS